MPLNIPQCLYCQHYDPSPDRTRDCAAFEEIPQEILDGDFDHRKPHPDDGGIQFLAEPGTRHPDDVQEDLEDLDGALPLDAEPL